MSEITASPPNFEKFMKLPNIWNFYSSYLCELRLPLCSEGVDQTHNRPLFHVATCLHCGQAEKQKEVGEWLSKSMKREKVDFVLFPSFHLSHYIWLRSS